MTNALYNNLLQMRITIIYKIKKSAYDAYIAPSLESAMRSLAVNVLIVALAFWGLISFAIKS